MGVLSKVASFFGGAGANVVLEGAEKILGKIDGLSTSAEEKGNLRKIVVVGLVEAQSAVIQSEMEYGTWLTRSWRPLVMLSFAAILVYTFFIGPMFGLLVVPLPTDLWVLLQIGLGGYVGGRSVEKLTSMVMPNIRLAKLKKKLLKKLSPEDINTLLEGD